MRERAQVQNPEIIRMMGIRELMSYLGLGRNTARTFAEHAGAVKHIGKRVLYDRVIIDTALDAITE